MTRVGCLARRTDREYEENATESALALLVHRLCECFGTVADADAASAASSSTVPPRSKTSRVPERDRMHRRWWVGRPRAGQRRRGHHLVAESIPTDALPLWRCLLRLRALRSRRRRRHRSVHQERREIVVVGDTGVSVPLSGVSCPQAQHCVAVGDNETVLATTDGGSELEQGAVPFGVMDGVSCTTPHALRRGDEHVDVQSRHDDGTTWTPILCPVLGPCGVEARRCGGLPGPRLRRSRRPWADRPTAANGGSSWTAGTTPTVREHLRHRAARRRPRASAVGADGLVLRSNDGGATWSPETPPTAETLLGVSCSE